MWIHGLSNFPLKEVRGAVDALILDPPDGWTGMPKLPDVIRQIHANREIEAQKRQRDEGEKMLAELRELEKRRDGGEKFYGLVDLAKEAVNLTTIEKPMPTVKTVWPDIDPNKNAAKLKQQAAELMEKAGKP